MTKRVGIAVAAALQLLSMSAQAGAAWSYHGSTGPDHWGTLDAAYASCATGRAQSPIDVSGRHAAKAPALAASYGIAATDIVNTGHTVQVGFAAGNVLEIEGAAFELKQLHFHAASEHRIHGKAYPLEVHFVHADSQGRLAVIGAMFSIGPANPALDKLWRQIPAAGDGPVPLESSNVIVPTDLMPANTAHYRYDGSLTTPPCSEGVRWHVMRHALTASREQIAQFTQAIHGGFNNRPLQPLHGRTIRKGKLK